MLDTENFGELKADYMEKIAALIEAVEETTAENCTLVDSKLHLASLNLNLLLL